MVFAYFGVRWVMSGGFVDLMWVTLEQRNLEGEGHPSLLERSAFGGKNC